MNGRFFVSNVITNGNLPRRKEGYVNTRNSGRGIGYITGPMSLEMWNARYLTLAMSHPTQKLSNSHKWGCNGGKIAWYSVESVRKTSTLVTDYSWVRRAVAMMRHANLPHLHSLGARFAFSDMDHFDPLPDIRLPLIPRTRVRERSGTVTFQPLMNTSLKKNSIYGCYSTQFVYPFIDLQILLPFCEEKCV